MTSINSEQKQKDSIVAMICRKGLYEEALKFCEVKILNLASLDKLITFLELQKR